MTPRAAFWNAQERRLRAGWRLVLQAVSFLIILIVVALLPKAIDSRLGVALAALFVYPVGVLASVKMFARHVDRRPFAEYGLRGDGQWWRDLGFGLLLGAFMLSGVFVTEREAGLVSVSGPAATKYPLPMFPAVLVSLLTWIAVAVCEELAFRGYQLKNLAEGLAGRRLDAGMSMTLAAVISSIVFSSAHFVDGNATTLSLLNVFLGGLLLSLPVVLTGQLALSIGLHISWNFFEGTVYGFAVSGTPQSTHLLTIHQTGPDLWTGGAFGPEGGLVCTGWMLLDSALVAAWLRFRAGPRRGH